MPYMLDERHSQPENVYLVFIPGSSCLNEVYSFTVLAEISEAKVLPSFNYVRNLGVQPFSDSSCLRTSFTINMM